MYKSKVHFSKLVLAITIGVAVVLLAALIATSEDLKGFRLMSSIIIIMTATAMYYSPKRLELSENHLVIRRFMGSKVIYINTIFKAERCYPLLGGIRLCGSGGFMGYWGYFQDHVIGTFFGYYGDRAQCILIRLNNGRQYVVSCEDPEIFLEELLKRINKVSL